MTILPKNDEHRAAFRLWDYYFRYFPHAQAIKAQHSYEANIKHSGEPGMKWASDKSVGDGNQIMRHLVDGFDAYQRRNLEEAKYHFACLAWRGDELLERLVTGMEPFDKSWADEFYAECEKTAFDPYECDDALKARDTPDECTVQVEENCACRTEPDRMAELLAECVSVFEEYDPHGLDWEIRMEELQNKIKEQP